MTATTNTYNPVTTTTYDKIICTITTAPKVGNNKNGPYAYCGAHIRTSKEDEGRFITLFAKYDIEGFVRDFGANLGNLVAVRGHFHEATGNLDNGQPKNPTVNGARLLRVVAESKRNIAAKAAAGLQATAPRAAQAMTAQQRYDLARTILEGTDAHVHANPGSALAQKAEALIG